MLLNMNAARPSAPAVPGGGQSPGLLARSPVALSAVTSRLLEPIPPPAQEGGREEGKALGFPSLSPGSYTPPELHAGEPHQERRNSQINPEASRNEQEAKQAGDTPL